MDTVIVIIFWALAAIVAWILFYFLYWLPFEKRPRERQRQKTRMEILAEKFPEIDPNMYQVRYRLMNNSEASFYHLLLKHLPEGFHAFPKMRIADIIKTKDGKGYYRQRNKILPKHVDFVICDSNLKPVCAIEIDGKSHDNPERQDRDDLIEYIFEGVHLPLKRIRVGSSFESAITEIVEILKR